MKDLKDLLIFLQDLFYSLFSLKRKNLTPFLKVVFLQIRFTGSQAFLLLNLIALIIGSIVILQASVFLPRIGQSEFVGNLMKFIIVREVAPLLTAIIVLIRSGSAIAAEIASQKVHKEIQSLEFMAINPMEVVVLPRVIGGMISMMFLTLYFNITAFLGGYLITQIFLPFLPFSIYIEAIFLSLGPVDFIVSFLKVLFFSLGVSISSCYYALKAEAFFHIPIVVSRALIRSLLYIFVVDILLTLLFIS